LEFQILKTPSLNMARFYLLRHVTNELLACTVIYLMTSFDEGVQPSSMTRHYSTKICHYSLSKRRSSISHLPAVLCVELVLHVSSTRGQW
jgi:hypothetical protein